MLRVQSKATKHLDYIKSLGVNAIELMPIQELTGIIAGDTIHVIILQWTKHMERKEYKQFIDECHKQGIAVLLDVVYNHATGSHPFAKLYWNSKEARQPRMIRGSMSMLRIHSAYSMTSITNRRLYVNLHGTNRTTAA